MLVCDLVNCVSTSGPNLIGLPSNVIHTLHNLPQTVINIVAAPIEEHGNYFVLEISASTALVNAKQLGPRNFQGAA